MKRVLSAALLTPSPAIVGPAFSHDTWMTPARRSVSPGAVLTLDMTSGMAFPALDHPIDPDRVERAFFRLAGRTSEINRGQKGDKSLRLSVSLDTAGVATLWVDLEPKLIELNPEEVEEYLDEIDAAEAIRKAWAGRSDQKPWREIYTKHTKTFVGVGEANDRSWAEPAMMALEIVPETDPTTLRKGDTPTQAIRALSNEPRMRRAASSSVWTIPGSGSCAHRAAQVFEGRGGLGERFYDLDR